MHLHLGTLMQLVYPSEGKIGKIKEKLFKKQTKSLIKMLIWHE